MASRYRVARKKTVPAADNGKHPGGRPPKYYPSICQELVDYFYQAHLRLVSAHEESSSTRPWFPTLEIFAQEHDITGETIVQWSKKYPEFTVAYKKAKNIQKACLIQCALTKKYDSTFSIFLAKNNFGMQDRVDLRQSGKLEISRVELPKKRNPGEEIIYEEESDS